MELLYDSHLNRLIDDFFLTKWPEPDQVRKRYFEISADLQNECTYGLIAFADITQCQTLASGDCALTQEWLEDVVLRESSDVTIALFRPALEGIQCAGCGVTPAPTTGAASSVGSGVTPAPIVTSYRPGNAVGPTVKEEVGAADMPWMRFPITDELIMTFGNWISWCYMYCREHEGAHLCS